MFFFLYDVSLQGISTKFSSRKITFVIFFLLFLYKCFYCNKKIVVSKKIIEVYMLEIAVCIFSGIHVFIRASVHGLSQSEFVEYPYVVYFILFGLLVPIFMTAAFENLEDFLKALIGATIGQSVFVILEFWIWPMKIWLDEHIYTTSNILYTNVKRATGLGASGAQLSVWLFFGVFACSYFLITKKKRGKYWAVIVLIFVAQFLSGRTGLYFGIVDVLIVGLYLNRNKRIFRHTFVKMGILGIIFLMVIFIEYDIRNISIIDESSVLTETISRNINIDRIIGENGFFSILFKDKVPSLTGNTLLGYGVVRGKLTKELVFQHDSGFIKRYIADGLAMAIVEYLVFFILLFYLWRLIRSKKIRRYMFGLIIMIFLVEIKEPFMYYYGGVAIILCSLMLASKFEVREGVP